MNQPSQFARYNNNNTTVELYDLSKDLSETDDVSSDNPDVVKMAFTYMNTAHVQGHYCGTHIDTTDLDKINRLCLKIL